MIRIDQVSCVFTLGKAEENKNDYVNASKTKQVDRQPFTQIRFNSCARVNSDDVTKNKTK